MSIQKYRVATPVRANFGFQKGQFCWNPSPTQISMELFYVRAVEAEVCARGIVLDIAHQIHISVLRMMRGAFAVNLKRTKSHGESTLDINIQVLLAAYCQHFAVQQCFVQSIKL